MEDRCAVTLLTVPTGLDGAPGRTARVDATKYPLAGSSCYHRGITGTVGECLTSQPGKRSGLHPVRVHAQGCGRVQFCRFRMQRKALHQMSVVRPAAADKHLSGHEGVVLYRERDTFCRQFHQRSLHVSRCYRRGLPQHFFQLGKVEGLLARASGTCKSEEWVSHQACEELLVNVPRRRPPAIPVACLSLLLLNPVVQ